MRAYNEGAKLRMCGDAWESLLAKLGTAATVLLKVSPRRLHLGSFSRRFFGDLLGPTDPQVRTALVYFSGADSLEEAVGLIPAHGELFIWKNLLIHLRPWG